MHPAAHAGRADLYDTWWPLKVAACWRLEAGKLEGGVTGRLGQVDVALGVDFGRVGPAPDTQTEQHDFSRSAKQQFPASLSSHRRSRLGSRSLFSQRSEV